MKIAVIPARGGSKRIPRKNIRNFLGKPIIAYSIDAALKSGLFERVIVSTDDFEIADVARVFGAEVPFTRPAELADDHAGTAPVVVHAIDWVVANNGPVDRACCVYATAPFVTASALSSSLAKMEAAGADSALAVTSFEFPIQRALRIARSGNLEPIYPEMIQQRSQDLEEAWHDAGQFYWGTPEAFSADPRTRITRALAIKVPRYLVQDIDTEEDWKRAELIFAANERNQRD